MITEKAKILLVVVLLLIFSRALFAQHEILVGPHYHKDSLLSDLNNPKGNRFGFEMLLSESKIYRGDDATLLYTV